MERSNLGCRSAWHRHLRLWASPFDPDSGEVVDAPIEGQTELVFEQQKLRVETAGSSLANVLKCNVYCTSVETFAEVNEIYSRYFGDRSSARILVAVPAWPGIRYRSRLHLSHLSKSQRASVSAIERSR
jgi:enamine deaminase RidA (YjgF/YER057c/UK114 family)